MKKMITVLWLTASGLVVNAQRIVTGIVVDETNAFPLQGAIITSIGNSEVVQTDAYGIFSIAVPDSVVTLVISYTGYEEKEVSATGVNLLKIPLERSGLRYDLGCKTIAHPGQAIIKTRFDAIRFSGQDY
jgi:hypothetical protein